MTIHKNIYVLTSGEKTLTLTKDDALTLLIIPNILIPSYPPLAFSDGCLRVICNYARKKGEELFSNYGLLSNEKLLFAFGFCIENNPHDSMTLKLMCRNTSSSNTSSNSSSSSNCSSNNSSNEQIEKIDGAKVVESSGIYYYVGRGGLEGIPKELWRTLSSLIGEDEDTDHDQPPEVGLEEIQLLHEFITKKLTQLEMSKSLAEDVLIRYEGDLTLSFAFLLTLTVSQALSHPFSFFLSSFIRFLTSTVSQPVSFPFPFFLLVTGDIRAKYIKYYRDGQTEIASELLIELTEIMISAENDDDDDDNDHEVEEEAEG